MRLQKELEDAKEKISKAEDSKGPNKKKAPLLGSIGKSPSSEGVGRGRYKGFVKTFIFCTFRKKYRENPLLEVDPKTIQHNC